MPHTIAFLIYTLSVNSLLFPKHMYIKVRNKWNSFSRKTNIKASDVSRTLQKSTRKKDYISLNN